jgi:hypothetical protein
LGIIRGTDSMLDPLSTDPAIYLASSSSARAAIQFVVRSQGKLQSQVGQR